MQQSFTLRDSDNVVYSLASFVLTSFICYRGHLHLVKIPGATPSFTLKV